MTKIEVMRYLLDEAEAREKEIQAAIKKGETKWYASFGKCQRIKDNMKKIRQLALEISKEV